MFKNLTSKFSSLFRSISGKSKITEKNIHEALEEIKASLIDADVSVKVVRRFTARVMNEALGDKVLKSVSPSQQFIKVVHDKLVDLLKSEDQKISLKPTDTVTSVLLLGLQGSGKTTTANKLALKLKEEGRRPLLVACDLVRPAAIDQIEILGKQSEIATFIDREEKDITKIVKNALVFAKKEQYNFVVFDTAGRLEIDDSLMNELKKIKDLVKPDETLLVLDSMAGQSGLDVATVFNEKIEVTGFILSKLDSDTRGGIALSLKETLGKPVKYVGTGEKPNDLELFYPERVASRILGMGDVVSLVEKAKGAISEEEALNIQKKMLSTSFTLDDYLDRFRYVKKMGSIKSLMELIPGFQGSNLSVGEIDDKELKREEAILLSMTKDERKKPHIIGASRKKRIAQGSGTNLYQVTRLLKNYEKMNSMMKKVTKDKRLQRELMSKIYRENDSKEE